VIRIILSSRRNGGVRVVNGCPFSLNAAHHLVGGAAVWLGSIGRVKATVLTAARTFRDRRRSEFRFCPPNTATDTAHRLLIH
jgi:hypothetical protein